MTTFTVALVPLNLPAAVELRAAIAAVEKLLNCADSLTRTAEELQDKLSLVLNRLNEEAAADNVFVRAVPKTPAQVTAEHEEVPDGSRTWWVVYIGREPGLYTTIEQADVQIKGCPNQQYRRKTSKIEALAFYEHMYKNNQVEKWVEFLNGEE
ncbi:hypothetical protein B0H10DRAFT_2206459 [Mycena sp. CBHHK59/15]|nr:hypothetical protein B0H10DRAFT_2206459 [Mycena sp. CBHHK59/15]